MTRTPRFERKFFAPDVLSTRIGDGAIGGKASRLLQIATTIADRIEPDRYASLEVSIPRMTIVTTSVFDVFMERNGLWEVARADDVSDEQLGRAFQRAQLPAEYLGDLRSLTDEVRVPLAVRSSSLLEDAARHPFAGVYATKMIPNNEPSEDARFRTLVDAIKLVYASTFSSGAKTYRRALDYDVGTEKMAVLIQEVVGNTFGDRFYPVISGVGRSHNPYAFEQPEDGVVDLALGLGRTIVDGGKTWSYCPAAPRTPPLFNSPRDMFNNTQTQFWAVGMGKPPEYDPTREAEYLVSCDLEDAEYDNTLRHLASTFDADTDRIVPGTQKPGPRVVTFGPILEYREPPLNDLLADLLRVGKATHGTEIEIEFAVSLGDSGPSRVAVLQMRPMTVSTDPVDVPESALVEDGVRISSLRALGNGRRSDIEDVVFLDRDRFDLARTPEIVNELEGINRSLLAAGRPYLLIGFGRWGTSDSWCGVPVVWPQISGARVIVEIAIPESGAGLSQGSHFFHNVTNLGVSYFSVTGREPTPIDWEWLDRQPVESSSELVRHVRLGAPLSVAVDGRTKRGVVKHA